MVGAFDFGSGMPLPPIVGPTSVSKSFETYFGSSSNRNTRGSQPFEEPSRRSDRRQSARSHGMPQLRKRMDQELLTYLESRRISPFFIHEIDQFLGAHPELATLQPDWCDKIRTLRPVDAYLFFLRGYTKPARYIDDAFPQNLRRMNLPRTIPLLVKSYDPELIDFFDGWDYRYDILEMIDRNVDDLARKHEHGINLTQGEYKMMCFGIYANPVDAYKYYEYNYQDSFLAHRYLPEHVILHDLPKGEDYCRPSAYWDNMSMPTTYSGTRLVMARANDAGVDVTEVLIEELISDLARRGFRRFEIDDLRLRAEQEIDIQRRTCGGADIVDLVMGLARRSKPSAPRRVPQVRKRAAGHHMVEARMALEKVLFKMQKAKDPSGWFGLRREAERELVVEVVGQAMRDRSMNSKQATDLLAMVPHGTKMRRRREKTHGVPDVLRLLAPWL